MGVIRTIAIIIIVYYVLKIIGRIFFPLFVKQVVKKAEQRFQEQQGNFTGTQNGKVGETVIDKKPITKQSNKNVGEYVDYEDVKD